MLVIIPNQGSQPCIISIHATHVGSDNCYTPRQ